MEAEDLMLQKDQRERISEVLRFLRVREAHQHQQLNWQELYRKRMLISETALMASG